MQTRLSEKSKETFEKKWRETCWEKKSVKPMRMRCAAATRMYKYLVVQCHCLIIPNQLVGNCLQIEIPQRHMYEID